MGLKLIVKSSSIIIIIIQVSSFLFQTYLGIGLRGIPWRGRGPGAVRTALGHPACSRVASHCSWRGRRDRRQLPFGGQLDRHSCCMDTLKGGSEGGRRDAGYDQKRMVHLVCYLCESTGSL